VDGFKNINDRWGHQTGDAFLIELARAWSGELEDGEILARLGGDEFGCLFYRSRPRLILLCRQVEERLTATFPKIPVGLSLGCAHFHPRRPAAAATFLAQVDRRLYQDKQRRHQSLLH
jgi:diguanylate cyclase (GGDEF)-like protein